MKTSELPDIVRWKKGFELLDELRRQEIRESSILVDAPILQSAFDSALFLQTKKSETGLGKLGVLLARMSK